MLELGGAVRDKGWGSHLLPLIYSCPRQNRKIHLQIPAKAVYTYILMPFLIKPAFLNNSQVKQHGF